MPMSIVNSTNSINNIVNFNNNDFDLLDIQRLNKKYNDKIIIVKFSKPGCLYCNICKNEYNKLSNELSNVKYKNKYIVAEIDCEKYANIGQTLKNDSELTKYKSVTYPTFIIYKNSLFEKEYLGTRELENFLYSMENIENNTKISNLSDKIDNIFPIKNEKIFNFYEMARSCFWIEKELDFSKDKFDWDNKLNKDERFFLSNILAFFSQSDQIVNINLEERFMEDVNTLPKDLKIYTKLFYNFQKMMEDIHSITYETLLDVYITETKTKNIFKNAIENVPAIKKKSIWASKWIDDKSSSFGTRLIAFAVLEGIFFSGSFCAIFWIKEKNILNGLCKSNEFISRDEGMHRDFAILLYNILKKRNDYEIGCNDEIVITIVKEAVEIEKEFITSSFNCNLIGMNAKEMKNYIEFVADNLLENLDIKKVYNTKNPFIFMENIGLQNKTNFFEARVTEYAKANSTATVEESKLSLDEDF
jgi:ribonucleotide reductase beta subunit family protein with ferritin-like domain